MWYEVAGELSQEGLRPVTPDQECLTEILHTHEEKAEETLKLQVSPSKSPLNQVSIAYFKGSIALLPLLLEK